MKRPQLFIHSWVEDVCGCFCVLTAVNGSCEHSRTGLCVDMHSFIYLGTHLGTRLGEELPGSVLVL